MKPHTLTHPTRHPTQQELQEETDVDTVTATSLFMKKIATRCHAKDKDFWPASISRAAKVLSSSPPSSLTFPPLHGEQQGQSNVDVLDTLLRPPSVEDIQDNSNKSLLPTAAIEPEQQQQQPSSSQRPPSPPVIYVSLDFVLRHTLQTMHQVVSLMATSVEERSNDIALVAAVGQHHRFLTSELMAKVDGAREWCRGHVLWPQIQCSRRSALRVRWEWVGMSFPVRSVLHGRDWHRSPETNLTKYI